MKTKVEVKNEIVVGFLEHGEEKLRDALKHGIESLMIDLQRDLEDLAKGRAPFCSGLQHATAIATLAGRYQSTKEAHGLIKSAVNE